MNIEFINDAYTKDGLRLPMVHFESKKKDICIIITHGMCGTIIDNYFATVWGKVLTKSNIGLIYEHNRGHSIENDLVSIDGTFKRYGCMYEIFEECLLDIDLAIKTAKKIGYKRIFLAGHSYGCNKTIYYYYKKKPDILGIIFASAPDMVGIHKLLQPNFRSLLEEAKINIKSGNENKLLSALVEDYMYMSSKTYYNWYNELSELNNLPIIENPELWEQFSCIDVPILAFSGENEEWYYKRFDIMKEKVENSETFFSYIIENTGHTYKNKELETANIIIEWIDKIKRL